MKTTAIAGPRNLRPHQRLWLREKLAELLTGAEEIRVGDASGVDFEVARFCALRGLTCRVFHSEGPKPYQLRKRTQEVVAGADRLVIFPNKPCPANLTTQNWQGSGTWGACFLARAQGKPVEIYFLPE